jgi:hypothetical protein
MFHNFYSENRAVYETMWKKIVESDRPATDDDIMQDNSDRNTNSEYVILRVFPCNNGCTNAPQCYVIRAVHCLSCYDFIMTPDLRIYYHKMLE